MGRCSRWFLLTLASAAACTGSSTVHGEWEGEPGLQCETLVQADTNDLDSGLQLCDDGSIHRGEPVTCEVPVSDTFACGAFAEPDSECLSDNDCGERPFGSCKLAGDGSTCSCHYGCETDADCGADEACICKVSGLVALTHCARVTDCATDKECPGRCGFDSPACGGPGLLKCFAEDDECRSDEDCTEGDFPECRASADGPRRCQYGLQCEG